VRPFFLKITSIKKKTQKMSKVGDESSLALAAFLTHYKRITVADACRQHIDQNNESLGIWVNQRGEWRRVSADEQKLQWSQYKAGRSVCQSVVRELFGLSAAQYAKIRASFENPGWRTWAGIYERRDESFKGPEFAIVVELPETSSALGVGTAAGVTVGAVGALAAKLLFDRSKSATVTPATVKSGASADSSQIQKLKDKLDEVQGINRQLTAKVLALQKAPESNEESGEDQGKIQQLEEELRNSKRAFNDWIKNGRESLTASQAEVARLQAELRALSESKQPEGQSQEGIIQKLRTSLAASVAREDRLLNELDALKAQASAAKPQKPSGQPLPEPKGPSKPVRERLDALNKQYANVQTYLNRRMLELGRTGDMRYRDEAALNQNLNPIALNNHFDWSIPAPVIIKEIQEEYVTKGWGNRGNNLENWKPYVSRYRRTALRPFTTDSKQKEKDAIQKQADEFAESALQQIHDEDDPRSKLKALDDIFIHITDEYYKSVPEKWKAAGQNIL
jgi:hypothetical protein